MLKPKFNSSAKKIAIWLTTGSTVITLTAPIVLTYADQSSTSVATKTDQNSQIKQQNQQFIDQHPQVRAMTNATLPKPQSRMRANSFYVSSVANRSLGVDVSAYQSTDMTPFARAGAKFCIVKLSEGTNWASAVAAGQIKSAEANGMQVQGYHFAHFGGNSGQAVAEANYAISKAQYFGLPKGSYLACDYETGASGNMEANTQAILAFMNRVQQTGYIPVFYSGAYYMKQHVNLTELNNRFKDCLWVASYATTGRIDNPNFNYFPSTNGVAIWQFTDNWKGLGVDGDINVLPLQDNSNGVPKPNPTPATQPSQAQPKPNASSSSTVSSSSSTNSAVGGVTSANSSSSSAVKPTANSNADQGSVIKTGQVDPATGKPVEKQTTDKGSKAGQDLEPVDQGVDGATGTLTGTMGGLPNNMSSNSNTNNSASVNPNQQASSNQPTLVDTATGLSGFKLEMLATIITSLTAAGLLIKRKFFAHNK